MIVTHSDSQRTDVISKAYLALDEIKSMYITVSNPEVVLPLH